MYGCNILINIFLSCSISMFVFLVAFGSKKRAYLTQMNYQLLLDRLGGAGHMWMTGFGGCDSIFL